MLHVVTLFSVPADAAGTFVRSIRMGGEWHTLARRLAYGFITTDLLGHHTSSTTPPFLCDSLRLYLALDFWTSMDAYLHVCRSPECQAIWPNSSQFAIDAFPPTTSGKSMQVLKTLPSPVHLDLQWTCCDMSRHGGTAPEIIEIGLVELNPTSPRLAREWSAKAICFSWDSDGDILADACRAQHVAVPFRRLVDLSRTVQHVLPLSEQVSIRRATTALGLTFDGCEHMTVADVGDTAHIHAEVMRRFRSSEPIVAPRPGHHTNM